MKCFHLTAAVIFIALQAAAQAGEPSNAAYSAPGSVIFKFCPPALFDDFSFPTVQAGIEYKISPRLSWYNEFGIKYRKSGFDKTDSSFVGSRGFKAKTEWRYYLIKPRRYRRLSGLYFAINGFFTRDYYNAQISYYSHTDTSTLRQDAFGVHKDVMGGNILFGFERILSKHWGFDVYGGLGLRVRNVKTIHQEYVEKIDIYQGAIDLNVYDQRNRTSSSPGISTTPNFTVGFRLCYRL